MLALCPPPPPAAGLFPQVVCFGVGACGRDWRLAIGRKDCTAASAMRIDLSNNSPASC